MREINLNRQLLGLEDLEFGTGTVEQIRAGTKVNITKINAGNLPFDETRTLLEFTQEVNMEALGNSVKAINNLNNDLDKILIVEDNLPEVVSVAQNIVPNLTEILNVDTLAAQVTQDKSDVSSMKLAVETIYDTFDDRFLGTKTVDPTLDNDGNALIDGAMYFNTSSNAMKVYDVGTTTWYAMPQIYLSALLDVNLTSITSGNVLRWNGTKWINYTLSKADVGLNLVDNTSDSAKNVLSATKLKTARTINGVAFDGSANITTYDSTKVAKVASTDNAIVRFNGTTGAVKDSLVTIDDAGNLAGTRLIGTGYGNYYDSGAVQLNGNGSTIFPTLGFHHPGVYGGTLQQTSGNEFSFFDIFGNYSTLKNNINMQNAINVNGSVGGSVLTSNVIVESGSNANGHYTKFANGSMMEYKSINCAATANVRYIKVITWPVSGEGSGTGAIVFALSDTYSYSMTQPPAFNYTNFFFTADFGQTYYFILTKYTP